MTQQEIFLELNLFKNEKYPDYKCVIPKYDLSMKFDVKEFKATITKLLPYSGTVNRISLHLNGAIEMRCEDIDYGKECAYKMTYISKEFPDMTIHLNGKLLLNALKIFKDKEIKMYSDGGSSRAITLTNGNETALVMPIFPNNSY